MGIRYIQRVRELCSSVNMISLACILKMEAKTEHKLVIFAHRYTKQTKQDINTEYKKYMA